VSSAAPYRIPIVDLRAQYRAIRDEVRRAIDEVADSQQFILGPAVQSFEEDMAKYLATAYAVGVASGSDALLLSLMALGVGPGDAVITTPFTFFSTVSSITRLGAKPLFVDLPNEGNLLSPPDVESFLCERAKSKSDETIDSKTGLRIKAILPVHLFGECCKMKEFRALAEKYRLGLVEDVAQACGARVLLDGESKFAGAIGDLGCFSFFPSKTLGGFGDGGLVATTDRALADKLRMLRMHGESRKYYHDLAGVNSRLDSLQAAVLSVKLKHLEEWCERRIQKADFYHTLFEQSGLMHNGALALPPPSRGKSHVFNNYVIRAERRDALKQFLAEAGIQSEIYYPLPLHLQRCFADLGYKPGDFPHAERAAGQVLALPIYPEITAAQQEEVVETIRAFYR
jgi:dTDP-4-amino-4,6-dideoxygalactose transaminase